MLPVVGRIIDKGGYFLPPPPPRLLDLWEQQPEGLQREYPFKQQQKQQGIRRILFNRKLHPAVHHARKGFGLLPPVHNRAELRAAPARLPWLLSWGVASSTCHPLYEGPRSGRTNQPSFQTWKFLQIEGHITSEPEQQASDQPTQLPDPPCRCSLSRGL